VEQLEYGFSVKRVDRRPIQILIVDDHEIVRRGIAFLLSDHPDFMLIGEASNGEQAVEQCAKLEPDIVLMDLRMPKMDGVQATRLIRARYPRVRVIVLTCANDQAAVTNAMQAGAISYLEKDVPHEHLAAAIRAAYKGNRTLSPQASQALINAAIDPPKPVYALTERETEVLTLMIEGLTNPEIAERLSVSRSTVKYHVSALFSKLGVVNRSEAVAFAFKHELL